MTDLTRPTRPDLSCDDVRELAASFVLGALDEDEAEPCARTWRPVPSRIPRSPSSGRSWRSCTRPCRWSSRRRR